MLLKGGYLVKLFPPGVTRADLRIEDDRITGRSARLKARKDEEVVDCSGRAILPGLVITPEKAHSMPTEIQKMALAGGRSTRLGEPEDIAAMVALLASKDGEWINGQAIRVCGGASFSL